MESVSQSAYTASQRATIRAEAFREAADAMVGRRPVDRDEQKLWPGLLLAEHVLRAMSDAEADERCTDCLHLREHHGEPGCLRSDPGAGWFCDCKNYREAAR